MNALRLLLALSLTALPALAAAPTLKVMTRNMDSGTDLNLVVAATDAVSFAKATAATLAEIEDSNIPLRASRLADEIASQQPDLIGLQEVTLWRTGPLSTTPQAASTVLYDQLDLLMSELGKRQLHYGIVAINSLTDIEAPVVPANLNLRLTDRDVFLARNDQTQQVLDIYNIQMRRYQVALPIGLVNPLLDGFTAFQGYILADVNYRGKVFRFANTHLLSPIQGVDLINIAQATEAKELLAALNDPTVPVLMVGDFNSNAEAGPDHTGTVESVVASGFTDVWHALNPTDPGYTWPLFGEDQSAGKFIQLSERIDLVFTRGLTPVSIKRLGVGGFFGAIASDHVGVTATVQIGN